MKKNSNLRNYSVFCSLRKSQQIVINDKLLSQITINHGVRLGSEQVFLDSYEKQNELYNEIKNKTRHK